MWNWLIKRIESLLDNLIFAGFVAGGVAVWAVIKNLPAPVIFTIALATFASILVVLRVVLSFKDRNEQKKDEEKTKDLAPRGGDGIHITGNARPTLIDTKGYGGSVPTQGSKPKKPPSHS